jgi:hypothetical protein
VEFVNATRMTAGYNFGLDPSGRELLVVVMKGTFRIPQDSDATGFALHEQQQPLVLADTFTGEPALSAPYYEADFAPTKPRCDILLGATAYAPGSRPTTRVEVEARIGNWRKGFAVVGAREWDFTLGAIRATPPQRFTAQPVSYDVAFGGSDLDGDDPGERATYSANPVGRGFHKHLRRSLVDGAPLPLTEESARSVTNPDGHYRPMSFGPVGRGWEPRYRFAGTYDDAWFESRFPFLPADFDPQYFQAAPADQQIPLGLLAGGAEVLLINLTPQGRTRFTIPALVAPVTVFPKNGPREEYIAPLDTVLIEPDQSRFSLVWRTTRPLKQNVFEIARVQVGKKGREWWQKREAVAFATPPRPFAIEP